MAYTLGQAAKATGRSKPTIQRAIKSGSLSAIKGDDGSYQIDPAELHRIFPAANDTGNAEQHLKRSVPPRDSNALQHELELLGEERDRERRQLTAQIESLERKLEQSEQERRDKDRQLTALLTDQRAQPKRHWWSFGRR